MHRIHFSSGDRADGDAWNIGIGGGGAMLGADALAARVALLECQPGDIMEYVQDSADA